MTRTSAEFKRDMMDSLPTYYHDSYIANNVIERKADEFTTLDSNIQDVINQFFVTTATWGLSIWESILGLSDIQAYEFTWSFAEDHAITFDKIEGDSWNQLESGYELNSSDADRRSHILARIRGTGPVSPAMLKSVAQSYTYGDVEIIEDFANYAITIKFVNSNGVPPNYQTLQKVIRDILPAHIGVTFTNQYSIWDDTTKTTWGNLANYTWQDVKGGLWNA